MTEVTLFTGCAGAGKTARMLEDYRAALARARDERLPGGTLWLVPNRRLQKAILSEIAARTVGACFAPNVLTFDRFAEKILQAAGGPASPISPVMKRLMLRRIVARLLRNGTIKYFRAIAETSGFLDVIAGFISELKREEVWPERFLEVCGERDSAFGQRDRELGLIYQQYQHYLEQQQWYDNEGLFWLARTELKRPERVQPPAPFQHLQFLAVDGFTDFTQTQYEILGCLAKWIERISIALPVEHPLRRAELFSKPHSAVLRIRDELPDGAHWGVVPLPSTEPKSVPPRQEWCGAVRVIADQLFCNPRFHDPVRQADGLELIQASGPTGEWEAVARRIKGLLGQGSAIGRDKSQQPSLCEVVQPDEIVIGVRAEPDEIRRLTNYLTSAGLPVTSDAAQPLMSSPIIKALLLLLQLELDDWPFDRLLAALDSSFFQPPWPELQQGQSVRAVAAVLRQLRLNGHRESMLRVLSRNLNESSSLEEASSDSLQGSLRLAVPLLHRLSRLLERTRRTHTLAEWADLLALIASELGWSSSSSATATMLTDDDRAHLDMFQRILRTAAEADEKLAGDRRPKSMDLNAFVTELRDLLQHEMLKPPPEPDGCLRILTMEQIRNLDVSHLFLLGLTEDSFPQNRGDDCLFSESERQDFIARGVALNHRSRRQADEMFLFYSVVTRARRSLTLSHSVVNSKGQPLYPSPYVTALISLFERGTFPISAEGQLDPVPTAKTCLTLTDLRLAATVEARQGRSGLYRSLLDIDSIRRSCLNTMAAFDVADHRFHQRGFTVYEGLLQLAQNLDGVRQRFDSAHQFSATEFESYARCPFQFWLSSVLGIEPVETPEEGTDFALRGTLLHDVLAQLLAEGRLNDPDALASRFQELVNEQLDRTFTQTELQRALIEIERSILAGFGSAFAEQQLAYHEKVTPVLSDIRPFSSEIPFGSLPFAPRDEDRHPPIEFGGGPEAVRLRGRIDRIDVGSVDGKPAYIVVDYKSGRRPSARHEDLISGRSIQLALYLVAAKRLGLAGDGAVPFQMGFWALGDKGFKHAIGTSKLQPSNPLETKWMEATLDQLLPQLASEIRSGRFVVENDDEQCGSRCQFSTVCRVNQLRPLSDRLMKRSAPHIDASVPNFKESSRDDAAD